MTLNEFHFMIGQTLMYCQVIEHDVKYIYAAMHVGRFEDNLEEIKKYSLGQTLQKLRELDFSDKNSYISEVLIDLKNSISATEMLILSKSSDSREILLR